MFFFMPNMPISFIYIIRSCKYASLYLGEEMEQFLIELDS